MRRRTRADGSTADVMNSTPTMPERLWGRVKDSVEALQSDICVSWVLLDIRGFHHRIVLLEW